MRSISHIVIVLMVAILCSCKGNKDNALTNTEGNMDEYLADDVNAINQALPDIMVIPSDRLLKNNGALRLTADGVKRDYQAFLLNNADNKALVSAIQDEFVQMGYPLNDLEQTLKQLATRSATDEADNLVKDSKTQLLTTAAPDIIIELDYHNPINRKSFKSDFSYTLSFIDPYTNKVISTKSVEVGETDDIAMAFSKTFKKERPQISKELKAHFADILTHGREISLRITVADGSNVSLHDESIEGGTYSDWIEDYLDKHSVKGAFKLKVNTNYEFSFTNVRVKLLNDDGTQFSAYNWGRQFAKDMKRQLGVSVSNRTQGLADVQLVITGIQ